MNKVSSKNPSPELRALATMLGYKRIPPSIDEFLDDPYYLGNAVDIYPFWRDKLREIYPSPIHTAYTIISLNCGLGSGKSTVARIMAAYNFCRLDHLEHFRMLGIGNIITKPILLSFFHVSVSKAQDEFINPLNEMRSNSPYFKRLLSNHNVRYNVDGVRSNTTIGADVIFYNLSEVNFINYDKSYQRIESAISRYKTRFQKCMGFFGNIIIDSSPGIHGSVTNDFIRNNPEANIYVVNAANWEAKAHLGIYFRQGSIDVYPGDLSHDPFIIDSEDQLTDKIDKDLILKVPKELEREFRSNLERNLRDLAGITLEFSGSFIKDKSQADKCFNLPHFIKDTIIVDFYENEDRLYEFLEEGILQIPKDKIIFIRFDIGVTRDKTGFAIGYFDDWTYPDPNNLNYKEPNYKVPIACSISRKQGQETSISKLKELVIELNKNYEIGNVTCDQFQSRQLIQDLNILGIPGGYLSVDRTNLPYNYFKNLMYNNQVELPMSDALKFELFNLKNVDGKIDHDKDKSKDISDAVVGLVYDIYKNVDLASQLSNKYTSKRNIDMIKSLADSGMKIGNFKNKVQYDISKNLFQ